MNKIIDEIAKYDDILIARHKMPDMDALGSQFALKKALEIFYPTKRVYAVGEELPKKFNFVGKLAKVDEEIKERALLITVDTPELKMLDFDYKKVAYLIKIDHHEFRESFGDYEYVQNDRGSCAEIVSDIIKDNYQMNKEIATLLMAGMITDTGRFLYSETGVKTFTTAAYLMTFEVDLQALYKKLYLKKISNLRLEAYVMQNFKVVDNVAYIIYPEDMGEKWQVSLGYLKSGTINVMRDLEGIDAWMTFSKLKDNTCIVEVRGFKPVVDVCTRYGGGGHLFACGCTIKQSEIKEFINDIRKEVK